MTDYQELPSLVDGDTPDQDYFNQVRGNQVDFNTRIDAAQELAEQTRDSAIALERPFTAADVGHLVVVGQNGALATREDTVSYAASTDQTPINLPRRYSGGGVRATLHRTNQTTDGQWGALQNLSYAGTDYPLTESDDGRSKTATIPVPRTQPTIQLSPPTNTTIAFEFPLDLTLA